MADTLTKPSQMSFGQSFTKGTFVTILALIVFASWAYFGGASYRAEIEKSLPFVKVTVQSTSQSTSASDNYSVADNHKDPVSHSDEHSEDVKPTVDMYKDVKLYEDNLVENSEYGLLPRPDINKGMTPFNTYRQNFILPTGQKKFQLVIGPITFMNEHVKYMAQSLPKDASILVSPYAKGVDLIMATFKESGHEIWLELPLEVNIDNLDTGPLALRADYSGAKNLSVYKRVLATTSGYTGLLTRHTGQSTLTFSSARMEQLQADMYQRGLGFAYIEAAENSSLEKMAESYGGEIRHIPMTPSDNTFLLLQDQWDEVLSWKQDVAVLHAPYPDDIALLIDWLGTLPEKGYILAPLSAN